MEMATTKYDSLIEHVSIRLPTAIVQVQILHVNGKLGLNGLQRRNRLKGRNGLSALTGHPEAGYFR